MSVLEELKKEAASVKAKQQRERSSVEAELNSLERELRSRMRALYGYLKEMADNLNVVDPDVRVSYDVRGVGPLKNLRQTAYRVSTPDSRALSQFTLHLNCLAEGSVKFKVEDKVAAERQRQYLWEHGMQFTCKSLADGSGVFLVETFVPVTFEFSAELDKGAIRLRTRNFEVIGPSSVSYTPEQITESFMDELAKAVLRKPSRFNELSGNTLSEEQRRQLRARLADDARRGRVKEAPVEAEEENGGRSGLLRSLLGKPKAPPPTSEVS